MFSIWHPKICYQFSKIFLFYVSFHFVFYMHHLNIFHHKTCFAKCSGGLIHKNWTTTCFQYNIQFFFLNQFSKIFLFHVSFHFVFYVQHLNIFHVGNVVCHYPWLVVSLNVTTSWSIDLLIWFFSQHYTQSIWTIVGLWHS